MAGIDQVVELLTELRDSRGVLGRASVLARGAAAMRDLSAQQKRELAVEVARRAAPQLVPRIEAETGMDLTPAQVSAVMDLALRMDREDLDELISTLRSDDARADLGREVVGAVGRELDDELDLGLLPPPPVASEDLAIEPSPPQEPTGDEDGVSSPAPDPDEEDAEIAQLRAELDATRREIVELQELETTVAEDMAQLVEAELLPPRAGGEREPSEQPSEGQSEGPSEGPSEQPGEEPSARPAPAAHTTADEDPTGTGADDLLAAGAVAMTAAAADQVAAVHELAATVDEDDQAAQDDSHGVADRSEDDDPEARARARAVVARIRGATSAGAALRAVARDVDALWHAGPEGRAEAVRAVPDGWARRRAIQRLVAADVVTAAEAPGLVRLLGRESDRIWALGDMVADHLVEPDDLHDLVSERARARLSRRRGPALH